MKTIGTVLPTKQSLAAGERAYREEVRKKNAVAADQLAGLERRVVGGETRYYASSSRYAIVKRDLKVQWFEVRADGDYPVR